MQIPYAITTKGSTTTSRNAPVICLWANAYYHSIRPADWTLPEISHRLYGNSKQSRRESHPEFRPENNPFNEKKRMIDWLRGDGHGDVG